MIKKVTKKEKKQVDKKEDKYRKISTAIANMGIGDKLSPTNLFRNIGLHPNTGRDLLDLYDSLKEIGFETVRGNNGNVRLIIRTDESLNIRNEIRDLKVSVINLTKMVDEIKSIVNNKKIKEKK